MTLEKAFVEKKIEELLKYADEAEKLLALPTEEIMRDSLKVRTLERLLQLVVDEMIDINQHFIRELTLEVSDDFQGTFATLGEHNVLESSFAQKLAPIVGLRNRIVHRYETVNVNLFIDSFKKNFPDIKEYARQIVNAILSHKE